MKNIKTFDSFIDETYYVNLNEKSIKIPVDESKKETGLMIIGRTSIDNNKISDVLDDLELYGEWNREGFWFLPEEEANYDELEKILDKEFTKRRINARFEGVF